MTYYGKRRIMGNDVMGKFNFNSRIRVAPPTLAMLELGIQTEFGLNDNWNESVRIIEYRIGDWNKEECIQNTLFRLQNENL